MAREPSNLSNRILIDLDQPSKEIDILNSKAKSNVLSTFNKERVV